MMINTTSRNYGMRRCCFSALLLSLILCAAGHRSMAATLAQRCITNATASTPATDFVRNGDGTVSHKKTGLVWKRCLEGQTWAPTTAGSLFSDGVCNGAPAELTWQQALQHAQTLNASGGFAGHADWRVPNIKQLLSIKEWRCELPTQNELILPRVQDADNDPNAVFGGSSVWSSTPDTGVLDGLLGQSAPGGDGRALVGIFSFRSGFVSIQPMGDTFRVRLVRIRDTINP